MKLGEIAAATLLLIVGIESMMVGVLIRYGDCRLLTGNFNFIDSANTTIIATTTTTTTSGININNNNSNCHSLQLSTVSIYLMAVGTSQFLHCLYTLYRLLLLTDVVPSRIRMGDEPEIWVKCLALIDVFIFVYGVTTIFDINNMDTRHVEVAFAGTMWLLSYLRLMYEFSGRYYHQYTIELLKLN